jgi:hypothetical protein
MQVTPDRMLQFCLWHEDERKFEMRAETLIDLRDWQISLEAAVRVARRAAASEVQHLKPAGNGFAGLSGAAKLFNKRSTTSSAPSNERSAVDPDATPPELLSSDDEVQQGDEKKKHQSPAGHTRRGSVSLEAYVEIAPITGPGITPHGGGKRYLGRRASCSNLDPSPGTGDVRRLGDKSDEAHGKPR